MQLKLDVTGKMLILPVDQGFECGPSKEKEEIFEETIQIKYAE